MLAPRGGRPVRRAPLEPEGRVIPVACALACVAALGWVYLLALRGRYWHTGHRLPPSGPAPGRWPAIAAVIPARNEAAMIPACLPSLLGQQYPGRLSVIVVDDSSSDGTAAAAATVAAAAGWRLGTATGDRELAVVTARATPPGWAGKVWAMAEGVQAASGMQHILFTDADIAWRPGALTALASAAADGRYALVSQMALLRTRTHWEKLLIPPFVYFFGQLYPFRWVSRTGARTAAAAGGCMLADAGTLARAGGLAAIRGARIDDVALAGLVKAAGGRCWLGLTASVVSLRPYDRLADIWGMVARSAYTQLHNSLVATAAVLAGLAWLYVLPPAAAAAGVALLAAGQPAATAAVLAGAGLAGWLVMSVTYLPMLRLYRLSPGRAPSLPLAATLYAAMTADSARRHLRGRGGEWKGRVVPPGRD